MSDMTIIGVPYVFVGYQLQFVTDDFDVFEIDAEESNSRGELVMLTPLAFLEKKNARTAKEKQLMRGVAYQSNPNETSLKVLVGDRIGWMSATVWKSLTKNKVILPLEAIESSLDFKFSGHRRLARVLGLTIS